MMMQKYHFLFRNFDFLLLDAGIYAFTGLFVGFLKGFLGALE
jgi:hypothetical protein